MMRIDTRPRKRNSGKADVARRFPTHLQWLRGRPCLLTGKQAHVCIGQMEAAHVDHAGGKGVGIKVHDKHTVPLCSGAHTQLHKLGAATWEGIYKVDLIKAAEAYAKASPKRHLWADQA